MMTEQTSESARPPWLPALKQAIAANVVNPTSRYVQLATVRRSGKPANRTVVFRGFHDDGPCLMFTTDLRSEKVRELAAHPWAETCWYFAETREQFRLSGQVAVLGRDDGSACRNELVVQIWSELSAASRESFYWPSPGSDWQAKGDQPESLPRDLALPPDTFGVLVLAPCRCDHLELSQQPHRRTVSELDDRGSWRIKRVHA